MLACFYALQKIAEHRAVAGSAFVGVRMIMNFHPTVSQSPAHPWVI